MKKFIACMLGAACMLSGCTAQGGIAGDPTAVMIGAGIGGMAGGLIGSSGSHSYYGSYRGGLVGSLVGTITGAAIASAATASREPVEKDVYVVETRPYDSRRYEADTYERRASDARMPDYGRYREKHPVDLEIRNIRFIDDSRDHVIESGERAQIIFEVVNVGRVAAYHVTPVVAEKNGIKHLSISSSVTLECIPAGDGLRYTATIRAGRMRKGEAVFHVTALDGRGGMIPVREFTIPLRK